MTAEDTDEVETPSHGEPEPEPMPREPAYSPLELDEETGSDHNA
jgi:hypothetical protein